MSVDPQTKAVPQQSMRNASSGFNGWNFTKLYLLFFSWGSNSAASACPSWLVNGILQHRNLLNNTDAMQCDAINAASLQMSSSTLEFVSWFNNDTGYKTRVPTCSLKMLQALRAESQYSMLPTIHCFAARTIWSGTERSKRSKLCEWNFPACDKPDQFLFLLLRVRVDTRKNMFSFSGNSSVQQGWSSHPLHSTINV